MNDQDQNNLSMIKLNRVIDLLKEFIHSLRPQQWYKNLVVFICIVFSLNFINLNMWLNLIFAFFILCFLSGSVYIFNDIIDLEKDKNHPEKKNRPIASGRFKRSNAIFLGIFLLISSFILAFHLNLLFFIISIIYFGLMIMYSKFLKEIIIVDILVISIGFVLRAVAGCIVIDVFISPWLIICTFLIAIFLGLNKRRNELNFLNKNAKKHRKILEGYSIAMLDQMTNITIASLIMSYSLYTFLTNNLYLMLTIPFIVYGIFRYLFLIHDKNFGGQPELLFKDRGIVISLCLWGILIILVLYDVPNLFLKFLGVI